MNIKELRKKQKEETRKIVISLRTFPSYSKWMKEKNISPSKLFNKALEELKDKEKK